MNECITVLSAELTRRLQSRAFRAGLLIGIFAVAAMIKAPELLGGALSHASDAIVLAGPKSLTDRSAPLLAKDYEIEAVTTDSRKPAIEELDAHKKAGAKVVIERANGALHVTVYARNLSFLKTRNIQADLAPLNLATRTNLSQSAVAKYLEVPLKVVGLDTKFASAKASDAAQGIAYTLLIFLYISILVNSQLLMTSVAEEKTSRIAELLIASVNPSALLAGKIAAAAILGIIQMVSWLAVGYVLSVSSSGANHGSAPGVRGAGDGFSAMLTNGISPMDIFAFAAFFIIGYLQLSTLFAAFASMINRTEDLGSVSGPLVMPVVVAFFVAMFALGFPNNPMVVISSLVPILSPFTMFARIAVSTVPAWQLALSFAINIAAIYVIAIIAGRIYRVGMMMYGRSPSFSQIVMTLRS